MRSGMRTYPSPRQRRPAIPPIPFDILPSISAKTKEAIEAAALEANDHYLEAFLEAHSFCPFARGGRQRGHTFRLVHYVDSSDPTPLLKHMEELASDLDKIVIQVICPLIDITPEAWERFCHDLTDAGNDRLRACTGEDKDVYAVAPLHPTLAYLRSNSYAIIPLFRRTPDPTIQWVRLDALQKLYAGRTSDAIYVDPAEILSFMAKPHREPLFDRIAETNLKMAKRLGIEEVERMLRDISRSAYERYARILLDDRSEHNLATGGPRHPLPIAEAGCPRHRRPVSDGTAPHPAMFERNGRWALAPVHELISGVGKRFLVADVEVFVIRAAGDIHVLHGRCPHRHAPLTDALVEGDRLLCPHHGWDFELATGQSQGVPGASVARFHALVEDGLLWVEGAELEHWRKANQAVFQAGDDIL